jgi:hypothetical protein
MKKSIEVLIILYIVFFVHFLSAVSPKRVVFSVSPQYVFSHKDLKIARSNVSITVFDSVGNPVPANTPVAIYTHIRYYQ